MPKRNTNRIYNALYRYYIAYNSILCKIIVRFKLLFQDVIIGNECVFYGNMTFEVGNGGKMVIGDRCIFRSKKTSNRIGLNHRCIFSTTPVDSSCELRIGNDCGFSGTSIWCLKKIIIGNNVRCGANSLIMDGDAHFEDERTSPPKPIIIEDNVFIGANVVVKKGVTIGRNSVIGMNSVVTHSVPANSIAVGNPCRIIKQISI